MFRADPSRESLQWAPAGRCVPAADGRGMLTAPAAPPCPRTRPDSNASASSQPSRSPADARIEPARPRRASTRARCATSTRSGDDRHMLIVTTDRLSAFDVVLPDPIPGKGRVLTSISNFWFARTRPHRAESPRRRPRSQTRTSPDAAERALARRPRMVVAQAQGAAGRSRRARLPDRLRLEGLPARRARSAASRCPRACAWRTSCREPIFTPSTKAPKGQHDENVGFDEIARRDRRRRSRRRCATRRSRSTSSRRRTRSRAASSSPTPSSSSASTSDGTPDADRRGADAGFVALLAGGHVRAGHEPAVLRQAVRARLPRDARLEQDARPARSCRRT